MNVSTMCPNRISEVQQCIFLFYTYMTRKPSFPTCERGERLKLLFYISMH